MPTRRPNYRTTPTRLWTNSLNYVIYIAYYRYDQYSPIRHFNGLEREMTVHLSIYLFIYLHIADFESEDVVSTKRSNDMDTNSFFTDRITLNGPCSSDEDHPLRWDPVVEACNKHVTLSQVDSGKHIKAFRSISSPLNIIIIITYVSMALLISNIDLDNSKTFIMKISAI